MKLFETGIAMYLSGEPPRLFLKQPTGREPGISRKRWVHFAFTK